MKFSDEVVLFLCKKLWVTKQAAQKMSHVPTCTTGNTGLTIHNSLKKHIQLHYIKLWGCFSVVQLAVVQIDCQDKYFRTRKPPLCLLIYEQSIKKVQQNYTIGSEVPFKNKGSQSVKLTTGLQLVSGKV